MARRTCPSMTTHETDDRCHARIEGYVSAETDAGFKVPKPWPAGASYLSLSPSASSVILAPTRRLAADKSVELAISPAGQ